jgi:predicted RNA-binding protein with RPS1 domain
MTQLKGRVRRVETFGVFVRLDNSDITAMCHISEAR